MVLAPGLSSRYQGCSHVRLCWERLPFQAHSCGHWQVARAHIALLVTWTYPKCHTWPGWARERVTVLYNQISKVTSHIDPALLLEESFWATNTWGEVITEGYKPRKQASLCFGFSFCYVLFCFAFCMVSLGTPGWNWTEEPPASASVQGSGCVSPCQAQSHFKSYPSTCEAFLRYWHVR